MIPMVYSIHSHEKVIHQTHCHVIRRIRKQYRRTFASPKEALAAGYCQCKICCPPIETLVNRQREDIEALLSKEKLKLSIKNGQAEVQSGAGAWRIIQDPETLRLQLFHKNTHVRKNESVSYMPRYHLQEKAREKTVLGMLKFISSHDAYRSKHPVQDDREESFIPHKFIAQGKWEAKRAKKEKRNGKNCRVNVQLRSEPDLSPWLTGRCTDTVHGFGRHNKRKKTYKPSDEPDAA